jgi:hypothetical protein
MQAFSEFYKKDFDAAMKAFAEIDIHPEHVIGLYSTLVNDDVRARYFYPFGITELFGEQLESAIKALTNYLTAVC